MNRGDIKLVIDQLDQYANGDEFQREVEMAVDMLETLGNKVAQQAAVIEKLQNALKTATSICWSNFSESQEVILEEALATPTDSKQILADWMREQLGDPKAWLYQDNSGATFSLLVDSPDELSSWKRFPLYKPPECLK